MQWQAGEYNVYKFVANRNQGNYKVLCGSTFGMVGQKDNCHQIRLQGRPWVWELP